MIRTIVADDHALVLEGLCGLLNGEPDIEVVATAYNIPDLVHLVTQHPEIDVVVTDLEMPPEDTHVLKALQRAGVEVRVLVLTAFSDFETMREAIEMQAEGYALKTESPRQVIEAIRQVAAGRLVYPSSAQRWLMGRHKPEDDKPDLSPRESEVIALLAEGLTNQELAKRLMVSENTVRFHLKNIFEKLNVNNRTEAAGWYLKNS